MIKQVLLLLGLTILAIIFQSQLVHFVHFLLRMHNHIAHELGRVFSSGTLGYIAQDTLALIAIPLILGMLVFFVLWAVKHQSKPHVVLTVWFAWLIMLVTILATR